MSVATESSSAVLSVAPLGQAELSEAALPQGALGIAVGLDMPESIPTALGETERLVIAGGDRAVRTDALGEPDGLVWKIAGALGIPGYRVAIAKALLDALPLDPQALTDFREGYSEGLELGFRDGFGGSTALFTWVRNLFLEELAVILDVELYEAAGEDLRTAIADGTPLSNNNIVALLAAKYPTMYSVMAGFDNILTRVQDMVDWLLHTEEFLELLERLEARALALIGTTTAKIIVAIVQSGADHRAQGVLVGKILGRVGYETYTAVLTEGLAQELKGASLVGDAAATADQLTPKITELFSIRKAMTKGASLEKAVGESYQGFGGGTYAPSRRMRYRTKEFNKFWGELQQQMGWKDSALRFDAHHLPVEARVLRDPFVKTNANWQQALQKLTFYTEEDMWAVGIETELHLKKGTALAEQIKLEAPEPVIESLDSLTVILQDEIGPLSQYPTFESYLDKVESIYRKEIVNKSGTVRVRPLWPLAKKAHVDIRRLLGLPLPPD